MFRNIHLNSHSHITSTLLQIPYKRAIVEFPVEFVFRHLYFESYVDGSMRLGFQNLSNNPADQKDRSHRGGSGYVLTAISLDDDETRAYLEKLMPLLEVAMDANEASMDDASIRLEHKF
ncbi:MAG: hypothetical protein HWD59_05570 [Coxiellaceae bacterium]|nr:MAG: hypothetical protein HWD59_05570 [Coxiellaceae bacterium]